MPPIAPEIVNNQNDSHVASVAALPEHLAIMKMDRDNIQALAAARPRNMEGIKADIEATLAAFPALAEEAIYRKPVGKVESLTDYQKMLDKHYGRDKKSA